MIVQLALQLILLPLRDAWDGNILLSVLLSLLLGNAVVLTVALAEVEDRVVVGFGKVIGFPTNIL